jgi:hypothetical protein
MSKIFYGKWRIIEMELWDQEFIDTEVQGYISFSKDGLGAFQFGYVHGFIDCRFSKTEGNEVVEFSWEGNDEMDRACGRGTAFLKSDELHGRILFHQGDDSGLIAVRI